MITFSKLGKYGSIGNQMFQYATLFSIGLKNNYEVKIPYIQDYYHQDYQRNEYFFTKCFKNISAKELTIDDKISLQRNITYNYPAKFSKEVMNIPDFSDIEGYFQSYKFFIDYKYEILKEFTFTNDLLMEAEIKYSNFINKYSCLHFRGGDYTWRQNYHPLMNLDYYKKAIETINSNNYLVFSDDIKAIKDILAPISKEINFVFVENNHPFLDLALISLCKNHIIANSSFGWWGAFLNKNQNNKVVAPKNWFGESMGKDNWEINDLIPSEWSLI